MNITFSPMRRDDTLALSKSGDTLTINGEAFDFSGLPNGATLPRSAVSSDWIAGDIERDDAGVLNVPLLLPHGPGASDAAKFPEPITVADDGPISLPE